MKLNIFLSLHSWRLFPVNQANRALFICIRCYCCCCCYCRRLAFLQCHSATCPIKCCSCNWRQHVGQTCSQLTRISGQMPRVLSQNSRKGPKAASPLLATHLPSSAVGVFVSSAPLSSSSTSRSAGVIKILRSSECGHLPGTTKLDKWMFNDWDRWQCGQTHRQSVGR